MTDSAPGNYAGPQPRPPAAFPDESNYKETAKQIERQQSGWIVLWGCYTQQFVAFPLFAARPGSIAVGYRSEALISQMRHIEQGGRVT